MRPDGTTLRRLGAVVLLVFAPAAAFLTRGVSIDNRLERWVGRDHEEDRRYAEFRSAFGSDELIVVALHGRPIFAADSLREMTRCLERLEAIDGIERVQGVPAVYRDLFGSEDPAELEREMTSTPFYTGLLLSPDARTAALLLEVAPGEDAAARRHLVDAVRSAVQPLADAGFRVALVGAPVLIVALDDLSKREAAQTFPIAVLGSLLVLAALLRSPRAMTAAAASSGIAVLLTLGLVVAVGGSLNMLTAALPSLLWVLGLSYSVHIISRYQRLRASLAPGDALRRALAETRTSCVFSAVTTALGFASLLVATMPPVRELGVFGAAGIMLALVSSMTVAPLVVELLGVPARRPRTDAHGRDRLVQLPLRRPRVVLTVAGILFAVAVASVPRIRLESNPLAFLPSDHRVSQDYGFVGSRVAGFHTAEVVLNLPLPWTDPATWPVVEGVSGSLAVSPIVARVVSPLDLLRKLAQWDAGLEPEAYRLPAGAAQAEALIGQLDDRERTVLTSLVTPDSRGVRLSVVVREMDEALYLGLVREARATLGRLPPGYGGYVTGQVLRLVGAQQSLIATQLRSLGLSLAVIFAAIWFGLRSGRLTLVAVPPNLLPIAVTFAAMAWLAIPLDAGTVMVASVSLGIAVDNTIHYLVEYRRARRSGGSRETAAGHALTLVAPPIAAATLAACTGFVALTLSSFTPIRYFGLLTTVMMGVALASHLLVTPAILAAGGRFEAVEPPADATVLTGRRDG